MGNTSETEREQGFDKYTRLCRFPGIVGHDMSETSIMTLGAWESCGERVDEPSFEE
jgi:hypothetical protein